MSDESPGEECSLSPGRGSGGGHSPCPALSAGQRGGGQAEGGGVVAGLLFGVFKSRTWAVVVTGGCFSGVA